MRGTQEIMEYEPLAAQIAPSIYDQLKKTWQREAKALADSLQSWERPQKQSIISTKTIEKVKSMPLQSSLTEVPFRDEEKGDTTSTVATSGCAIVVAKFLERYFDCDKDKSIAQIAEIAVKLGYRGYKLIDGTWKKMGMSHIWFDKFVPRYYALKSKRISNINEILKINANSVPVLLVKNSVYKNDEKNSDSHFVCVIGVDTNGYILYDPERDEPVNCEFERIHKAIRIGWVISR